MVILLMAFSQGPQHGPTARQQEFFKAKDMLRKQRREVFRQFSPDGKNKESYRSSLKDHDFGVQQVIIYDRLALERHDYTATQAERMRYSEHFVLTPNAEGTQPPRQLCPDYEEAKRECQRLQDEFMAAKGPLFTPIHAR